MTIRYGPLHQIGKLPTIVHHKAVRILYVHIPSLLKSYYIYPLPPFSGPARTPRSLHTVRQLAPSIHPIEVIDYILFTSTNPAPPNNKEICSSSQQV